MNLGGLDANRRGADNLLVEIFRIFLEETTGIHIRLSIVAYLIIHRVSDAISQTMMFKQNKIGVKSNYRSCECKDRSRAPISFMQGLMVGYSSNCSLHITEYRGESRLR